jgi:hypothetical protein
MVGAVIKTVEHGVFLIDTTQEQPTIFSFNAFLEVELIIESQKPIKATKFILFPSLVFRYDPKSTKNLKNADIVRISIINSIKYLDFKNE